MVGGAKRFRYICGDSSSVRTLALPAILCFYDVSKGLAPPTAATFSLIIPWFYLCIRSEADEVPLTIANVDGVDAATSHRASQFSPFRSNDHNREVSSAPGIIETFLCSPN